MTAFSEIQTAKTPARQPTFSAWLLAFTDADSARGDLARDWVVDRRRGVDLYDPRPCRLRCAKSIRAHIARYADDLALAALDAAVDSFHTTNQRRESALRRPL